MKPQGLNLRAASVDTAQSKPSLSRRDFVKGGAIFAGGLALAVSGCAGPASGGRESRPIIAFNTANLVARVSGYRYELRNWGEQHRRTVEATDEKAWEAICQEIAQTGFRAVEIWEAHAAPETMNAAKAATWRRILDHHGLTAVAYAGELRPETLQICQWLGIPHVDGGLRGQKPEEATRLCEESGVKFNFENHPEKNLAQILEQIGGGNPWLGMCVDSGWLGTQGVNAPELIRAAGPLVRHVHVKDVRAVGAHETCALGEGIVNVAGCLSALHDIGYKGTYSWEDEPEDRNPFASAVRNRRWIENHLVG